MHVWIRVCTGNTTGFMVTAHTGDDKKRAGEQRRPSLTAALLNTDAALHGQTDAERGRCESLMSRPTKQCQFSRLRTKIYVWKSTYGRALFPHWPEEPKQIVFNSNLFTLRISRPEAAQKHIETYQITVISSHLFVVGLVFFLFLCERKEQKHLCCSELPQEYQID